MLTMYCTLESITINILSSHTSPLIWNNSHGEVKIRFLIVRFMCVFLQIYNLHMMLFFVVCLIFAVFLSVYLMNEHAMQTGVYTDHCNYGALGKSSFLCRFICHINKGISSMYGGWWQQENFEKINELWQCYTWGEKSVAISSGLCWHRVLQYERRRWREASDCWWLWSYILLLSSPVTSLRYCVLWSHTLHVHDTFDWRCYSGLIYFSRK